MNDAELIVERAKKAVELDQEEQAVKKPRGTTWKVLVWLAGVIIGAIISTTIYLSLSGVWHNIGKPVPPKIGGMWITEDGKSCILVQGSEWPLHCGVEGYILVPSTISPETGESNGVLLCVNGRQRIGRFNLTLADNPNFISLQIKREGVAANPPLTYQLPS